MPSNTSNFDFLRAMRVEWDALHATAREAESHGHTKPRYAAVLARIGLETLLAWLYDNTDALKELTGDARPSVETFTRNFQRPLPPAIWQAVKNVQHLGNEAAHPAGSGIAAFPAAKATEALRGLYLFGHYALTSYCRINAPAVPFDESLIPDGATDDLSPAELARLQAENETGRAQLEKEKIALMAAGAEKDAEIARLRQKIDGYETIQTSQAQAGRIYQPTDPDEAATRATYIDGLLEEAGWNLAEPDVREYYLGKAGYADYVLWDDNGLPLAVVEAKRTSRMRSDGKAQVRRYANALEAKFAQRPLMYYTNGYETDFWDDTYYPPRPVSGFRKREELRWLIGQRPPGGRQDFGGHDVSPAIADRYYQKMAVQSLADHWGRSHRKALLVMATGTGKTRTAAALVNVLIDMGWARRVLFLADRVALVEQAHDSFKQVLGSLTGLNLLEAKADGSERLVFSTYGTMSNIIDAALIGGVRTFGPGHFDLVIVDEAHRTIYKKYRALLAYFDGLLLGLTATPKEDTDHDTYAFFGLPNQDPTYHYSLDQGVADQYLVPYRGVSVPLKFPREGIRYDELSAEEQEKYEETFADPDGNVPPGIDSEELNKWLFNHDTIDKVLLWLMEKGQRVEGGDRIGKTIVFARNRDHAQLIVERFDVLFPEHRGLLCQRIDYLVDGAAKLIKQFAKIGATDFQIAVSVDMLDTGIDIPELVNLVFFKRVLSKAKFWQMVGRGTRLCHNLFALPAPDDDARYPTYALNPKHKQFFYIFDFCGNFEFFTLDPRGTEPSATKSLSEKIFNAKLRLAILLQNKTDRSEDEETIYVELLRDLKLAVWSLNKLSYVVKQVMRYVDKYSGSDLWLTLDRSHVRELEEHLSPLVPSRDTHEEARRFDLLLLTLSVSGLEGTPDAALAAKAQGIAQALTTPEKQRVPMIVPVLPTLLPATRDDFWRNPGLAAVNHFRQEVKPLVHLVERTEKAKLYTNFTDEIQGEFTSYDSLVGYSSGEAYQERVQQFIRQHRDHLVIQKLVRNIPITARELDELEELLFRAGDFPSREPFEKILGQKPLGVFVRSILGLDSNAAKEAFSEFLSIGSLNKKQTNFIHKLIELLVTDGVVQPAQLYENQFKEIHDGGLDGVFDAARSDRIVRIVRMIGENALAGRA